MRLQWNSRGVNRSYDLRGKRREGRQVPARSAGQHSKTIIRHVFRVPGDISPTVSSPSTDASIKSLRRLRFSQTFVYMNCEIFACEKFCFTNHYVLYKKILIYNITII